MLERADRRQPSAELWLSGTGLMSIGLAGLEQAIHTPNLALATMLHRSVVLAHGTRDAWVDVAEAELLVDTLRAAGNEPVLRLVDSGHDLAEASDSVIGELAAELAARLEPRELPPVLVALEELGSEDVR